MNARRRPAGRYLLVAVVAVLALLAGLVVPAVGDLLTGSTARTRIAADPPPTLFDDGVAQRVDTAVDPQQSTALHLIARWKRDHGTERDDAAFVAWVEAVLPAPPGSERRARELTEVERLDTTRTPDGIAAATWLEVHGKKDIWKLAVHDQAEYLSSTSGEARKNAVDDLLRMAKEVADTLGNRFQASAPYVLEPALRPDHQVAAGDVCPCSYPSRHAADAGAARTYLGALDPPRDADYRWWQEQVDYSRLYMAGHVISDIAGGTLLGDLIGDYFLLSRDHVDPATVRTTLAAGSPHVAGQSAVADGRRS